MSRYVNDMHELANDIIKEVTGQEENLLLEDLSNVVDVGRTLFANDHMDSFVKGLIRRIGRTVVETKNYKGKDFGLLATELDYGTVLQKIKVKMPNFSINEEYNLNDGETYECQLFYGTETRQDFFESKNNLEIDVSIAKKQCESAFTSPAALESFVGAIFAAIANRMSLIIEQYSQRMINLMIADNLYNVTLATGNTRAINVLKMYNDEYGLSGASALTAAKCLTDPAFIKYFCYIQGVMKDRLEHMTTLYNLEGWETFTAKDQVKTILYSPLYNASKIFLQSGTYHKDLVALEKTYSISAWQGIGDDFGTEAGTIYCKDSAGHSITGPDVILGVMFDPEALMVVSKDPTVDSFYNPKGGFTNYFEKLAIGGFYDKCSNAIVLYAEDPA